MKQNIKYILIILIAVAVSFHIVKGANTFPTSLNSFSSGDTIESDWANSLESKIGIDSSSVTTSLDYLLKSTSSLNPGHKHTLANGATDVTATYTELNILDGATLSTTELNYVDGVTSAIQTQLDSKATTNAFLTDIAALTDPNADRILFFDDSAGDVVWLTPNTGITISGTNLNVDLGTSISASEIADGDHGDFTYSSGSAAINADAVALATDTTGNYAATIADAGNSTITVSGSGSENASITLDAVDLNCTNCIGETEISDVYLLNNADDSTSYRLTMSELVVDTSVLTVNLDGYTDKVGVGTTTPASLLTIGSTGGVQIDDSGNLTATGTITGNVTGDLTGNASTATALASNPTDCSSNQFANAIAASGNLACSAIADGDVPDSITIDLATLASTLTITDNENTNENNAVIFTSGGDLDGGNLGLESDGDFYYNPSTGMVTATGFTGALTGNASTATALAANGANCSAGQAPLGVDASGAAESCTDFEEDLSNSAGLAAALSDETGSGLAVFATSPSFSTYIGLNALGEVRFYDSDSSNYVGFEATSTVASDLVWSLPAADGTNGQVLTTNGSGGLTWSTAAGGSGDVTAVGDCADGACLDGSSDGGTYIRLYDGDSNYAQLDVGNLTGDITVNLPLAAGTLVLDTLGNLGTVAINTSLISDTDNTDDLGSSTKEWKDLYIDGVGYIDDLRGDIAQLGGATNYINVASGGVLTMQGSATIDGVAAGNLLDKSATETITGSWTHNANTTTFYSLARDAYMQFESYAADAGMGPWINTYKSHQDTEGYTATIDGEQLFSLWSYGVNSVGSSWANATKFIVEQEGASSTYPPGIFRFFTSDGTNAAAERLRIAEDGGLFAYNLLTGQTGTGLVRNASNEISEETSSARFKKDILPLKINTAKLYDLKPKSFRWKESNEEDFGLIAEEVALISPELVFYKPDYVYQDKITSKGEIDRELVAVSEPKPYAVKYDQLSILLLEELKTLKTRVDNLEDRVAQLEAVAGGTFNEPSWLEKFISFFTGKNLWE